MLIFCWKITKEQNTLTVKVIKETNYSVYRCIEAGRQETEVPTVVQCIAPTPTFVGSQSEATRICWWAPATRNPQLSIHAPREVAQSARHECHVQRAATRELRRLTYRRRGEFIFQNSPVGVENVTPCLYSCVLRQYLLKWRLSEITITAVICIRIWLHTAPHVHRSHTHTRAYIRHTRVLATVR